MSGILSLNYGVIISSQIDETSFISLNCFVRELLLSAVEASHPLDTGSLSLQR